jgi:hypothetical protein
MEKIISEKVLCKDICYIEEFKRIMSLSILNDK